MMKAYVGFCLSIVSFLSYAQQPPKFAKRPARETFFKIASQGDVAKMSEYIKKTSSPNTKDAVGMTPLMYAVKRGQLGAIIVLLNANADVTIADKRGNTAIHYAAFKGDITILNQLLEKVKDKKTLLNKTNKRKLSAYKIAKIRKNDVMADALVAAGAEKK